MFNKRIIFIGEYLIMSLIFLRITSLFRMIGILFAIALSAIFSIPSAIINRSGYLGHIFAQMGGRMVMLFAGVKIHCKGTENIDKNKVQVFAANHLSYFDVPLALYHTSCTDRLACRKRSFQSSLSRLAYEGKQVYPG